MINNKSRSDVKHAQRESFFHRELSELFMKVALDEPRLQDCYISRVELSPDRGHVMVFFHTSGGFKAFQEQLPILILYKPSLRSALSKVLQSRYTPELRFSYDEGLDKQNKIEELFRRLEDEGKL